MKCEKCNSEIPKEEINIKTDIAKCNSCGNVFRVSDIFGIENKEFDFRDSPTGTWYIESLDESIIGATTRSKAAYFLVPFMLVWSGGSLGGIYGTQLFSKEFDLTSSLFGIPFILGSIIFWAITIMAIWGKIEIVYNNVGGKIFTGVWKVGRSKYFHWKEIRRITERAGNITSSTGQNVNIVFEGKNWITFGTGLTDERRYYLLQALVKMHRKYN